MKRIPKLTHGGTGDASRRSVGADPSAEGSNTWGKDIKIAAEVGETGSGIVLINGADGDGSALRCGREVGGVLVAVTGCDNYSDTGVVGTTSGGVGSRGEASTQRHGDDGAGRGVLGDPVDTGDDTRVASTAAGAEDLYGDNTCGLGNTVGATSNGTGTVSSVAITVGILVEELVPNYTVDVAWAMELDFAKENSAAHETFTYGRINKISSP